MRTTSIPRLERLDGNVHQLFVHDEPFLMRAGEIHNSSSSSARWMSKVWPQLVENNINTVLAAVSWEMIEPEEGKFEFEELDKVLEGAREHDLKLILLWFGSFKNGQSTYAPHWIKTNPQRFTVARTTKDAKTVPTATLSVFDPATSLADATAFAALMHHISEVDRDHHTVIMTQVENEVGLLGDTRDRSAPAIKAFSDPVPGAFLETLRREWGTTNHVFKSNFPNLTPDGLQSRGSWSEVFGASEQTDELFMAYHYALFLEQVAAAGKASYPIPMFANAWLRNLPEEVEGEEEKEALFGGGVHPGDYPCGGPVETVLDIWQLFAPSLDFLAPDIYLSDYIKTCELFTHRNQALFIPEQRRDEYGALRTWEAVGRLNAIATSPFAVDSDKPSTSPFTMHYDLLRKVSKLVLDARANGVPTYGFFFDRFEKGQKDPSPVRTVRRGNWDLTIARSFCFGHPSPGFGMVIQRSDDTFLLIGEGFSVTFTSTDSKATFNGILSIDEKEVVNENTGELATLRKLNGDESGFGKCVMMPAADVDMGDFVIPCFNGAQTRIVECRVYYIKE